MSRSWMDRNAVLDFRELTEAEHAQIYDIVITFIQEHWTGPEFDHLRTKQAFYRFTLTSFLEDRVRGIALPLSETGIFTGEIYEKDDGSELSIDMIYDMDSAKLVRINVSIHGDIYSEEAELPDLLGWALGKPTWIEAEYQEAEDHLVYVEHVGPNNAFKLAGKALGEMNSAWHG